MHVGNGDVIAQVLWVTDSERVIDDHPTRPNSMTMEKWKERKY